MKKVEVDEAHEAGGGCDRPVEVDVAAVGKRDPEGDLLILPHPQAGPEQLRLAQADLVLRGDVLEKILVV